MVVGGTIQAAIFCCTQIPITSPLPLIRNESLNRQIFGALALIFVAIGIGLVNRSRIAWYALLACFGIGVAVPLVGIFDKPFLESVGFMPLIFASIINAAWGVGLYIAMRSVFQYVRER